MVGCARLVPNLVSKNVGTLSLCFLTKPNTCWSAVDFLHIKYEILRIFKKKIKVFFLTSGENFNRNEVALLA